MTLVYLIPFLIVYFLHFLAVVKREIDVSWVTEQSIWLILALALVLAVSALCWRVSCRIMEKQDL